MYLLIEKTNKVKKREEQKEIEKIPKGLVISPRCHQKIRKAYCKSCHVFGEKNCRGGGEVDGTGESIPRKWQEAKTRKGELGGGGRGTIGILRFLKSRPCGLVL